MPPLPSLAPFTFRHWQGLDDTTQMLPVAQAARDADGIEAVMVLDELRHFYSHLINCDPATDMLFAEAAGQLVGYVRVFWEPENDGTRVYPVFGIVHPHWRRQGLGRALHRWGEARLRELAAAHPVGPRQLRAFAQKNEIGKIKLLTDEGFEPTRYFYEMVRPHLDDLPTAPLPSGFEVRAVLPEHYRAIFAANTEAFRDHWGAREVTEEHFQLWFSADNPEFQTDIWKVAWEVATNEVAGMVLGYILEEQNAKFSRLRGWTENIGVRRQYRKRGLASALIAENLRELQRRGMTEAALAVDSTSPSGANRLYEQLGFRVTQTGIVYEKAV